MDNKFVRFITSMVCAVTLLALPLFSSCSSQGSLAGSSSSTAAEAYYLGIDANGNLALYKGAPGDGSTPVRTTDVAVSDLHETVVEGLKQGIAFDSFNDALERIGDYREAAKARQDSREAQAAAEQGAAEGEGQEAAQAEASAEAGQEPAAEVSSQAAPEPAVEQPEQVASDENAPAGEFWGVWLNTFTNLDEAYAAADKAKSEGFASEVFEVTNWDGVTYVVGAGEFATKSEAQQVLSHAYELGYASAYLHTAARQ